jgi:hypothetical protein
MPYLVTFPRSGSHYFDKLVYEKEGIHIEKSHSVDLLFDKNNNKIRKIITIVRDPKDSITSFISLEEQRGRRTLFFQNLRIHQMMSEYVTINNFLYENADYVIDFNDLLIHPDLVIKKIIELLEINKEDYKNFNTTKDEYPKTYILSSKNLSSYDKNILDNFNMDLCYFYYNKMLERKIII